MIPCADEYCRKRITPEGVAALGRSHDWVDYGVGQPDLFDRQEKGARLLFASDHVVNRRGALCGRRASERPDKQGCPRSRLRRACVRLAGMSEPVATLLRALAERYARLLREALGERLVSVVLFGSVGRGEATPNSDIDLLIVADDLPRGQFARKRLLEKADRAFDAALVEAEEQGIDTRLARIVRTPAEAGKTIPLYLDMTEDAVLLYDRGGFFTAVLEGVRASLRRLGSRRVRQGNLWYWDLKPDFKPGDEIRI
jgi:predicted nucleotidyltransferase